MQNDIVRLPIGFVGLKYFPGYYWNIETEKLYSLKSGVLKPLKLYGPNQWAKQDLPYYCISVNGFRKSISIKRLKNLKEKEKTYQVRVDE